MSRVRQMLDEHEREILERLAALRGQITPLEQELHEVRMAKSALQREGSGLREPQLALANPAFLKVADIGSRSFASAVLTTNVERSPYAHLTIKQLVLKALRDHFPHGATANQMLDLFANVWGRGEIARTSLSPQLSRLKEGDHLIFRQGRTWHLRHPPSDEKAAVGQ
jgi:hypothetical protein